MRADLLARRIGSRLREAGTHAGGLGVGHAAEPSAYDAVVLGSAVYMGWWPGFSSCATGTAGAVDRHPAQITGRRFRVGLQS
jgi:hypothetical protein